MLNYRSGGEQLGEVDPDQIFASPNSPPKRSRSFLSFRGCGTPANYRQAAVVVSWPVENFYGAALSLHRNASS